MRVVRGAPWTESDDRYLEAHRSSLKIETIADKLHKTPGQVQKRATYLSIDKCSDGYTVLSLSRALGCRQSKIIKWIECGWLHAKRRKTDRPRDIWYISENAVLHFLRWHYNEISLAHVNQDWFFDIIFGGRHGIGVLEAPRDESAIL